MNCPTCAGSLVETQFGGETIDRCEACQAAWYDSSELMSVVASRPSISGDPVTAPPDAIDCPKCQAPIRATLYAHDSGIRIHKCATCRGVWLPDGRLQEIADYRYGPHPTDKVADAIAQSHAEESRRNHLEQLVYSRRLSMALATLILLVSSWDGIDAREVLRLIRDLIVPMACVCFGLEIAQTIMPARPRDPAIDRATPGVVIALGGWLVLLAHLGAAIYQIVAG